MSQRLFVVGYGHLSRFDLSRLADRQSLTEQRQCVYEVSRWVLNYCFGMVGVRRIYIFRGITSQLLFQC